MLSKTNPPFVAHLLLASGHTFDINCCYLLHKENTAFGCTEITKTRFARVETLIDTAYDKKKSIKKMTIEVTYSYAYINSAECRYISFPV